MEKWLVILLCIIGVIIIASIVLFQIIIKSKKKKDEKFKKFIQKLIASGTTPKLQALQILKESYRIYGNETLTPEKFENIFEIYQKFCILFVGWNTYAFYSEYPTIGFTMDHVSEDTYLFGKKIERFYEITQMIHQIAESKGTNQRDIVLCRQYMFKNYRKGDDVAQKIEEYLSSIKGIYFLYWNEKGFFKVSQGKLDYKHLQDCAPDFDIRRIVAWKETEDDCYIAKVKPPLSKWEKQQLYDIEMKESNSSKPHTFQMAHDPFEMDMGRIINQILLAQNRLPMSNEDLEKLEAFYLRNSKNLYEELKAENLLTEPFQEYFLFDYPLNSMQDYQHFHESILRLLQHYSEEDK